MKFTLIIQDNNKQIVLTPETEWDRTILKLFPDEADGGVDVLVKRGSAWAECQGGWVREYADEGSLILVLRGLK